MDLKKFNKSNFNGIDPEIKGRLKIKILDYNVDNAKISWQKLILTTAAFIIAISVLSISIIVFSQRNGNESNPKTNNELNGAKPTATNIFNPTESVTDDTEPSSLSSFPTPTQKPKITYDPNLPSILTDNDIVKLEFEAFYNVKLKESEGVLDDILCSEIQVYFIMPKYKYIPDNLKITVTLVKDSQSYQLPLKLQDHTNNDEGGIIYYGDGSDLVIRVFSCDGSVFGGFDYDYYKNRENEETIILKGTVTQNGHNGIYNFEIPLAVQMAGNISE